MGVQGQGGGELETKGWEAVKTLVRSYSAATTLQSGLEKKKGYRGIWLTH